MKKVASLSILLFLMIILFSCTDNDIVNIHQRDAYQTEMSLSDFQQDFLASHRILNYFFINDYVFVEYKFPDDQSYFQTYLSRLTETSLVWTIGPNVMQVVSQNETYLEIAYHNNTYDYGYYHIDIETGEISYHVQLDTYGHWLFEDYYYTASRIENENDSNYDYTYNIVKVGQDTEDIIYTYESDWTSDFEYLGGGYFYMRYTLTDTENRSQIVDATGRIVNLSDQAFEAIPLKDSFLITTNNQYIIYDYDLNIINQMVFDSSTSVDTSYIRLLDDGILIRTSPVESDHYHKLMYDGTILYDLVYSSDEIVQILNPIELTDSINLVTFKNQETIVLDFYKNQDNVLYRKNPDGTILWSIDFEVIYYFDIIDDCLIFINTSSEQLLYTFDGVLVSSKTFYDIENNLNCLMKYYQSPKDAFSCIDYNNNAVVLYNGNLEELWRKDDLIQVFETFDTSYQTYLVLRSDEFYEHPFYGPMYYVLLDSKGDIIKSYKDAYDFNDVLVYDNKTFFIGSKLDGSGTFSYTNPWVYEIDAKGEIINQRSLIQTTVDTYYTTYWVLDGTKIIQYHIPR